MKYIPEHDRSEEFGWKKWSEEKPPTEEEQNRWSLISIIICILLGAKVLIVY